jgi:putative ABC transport system substrate-binding protein
VTIEYRWAEGHFDELDTMAAELVADGAALISATGGSRSAEAAKNSTPTIPIVFVLGVDPVKLGLVTTFNKPGGNITGLMIIANELVPKRLNLLYDLDPGIRNAAFVVNPESPTADVEIDSGRAAARPFFVFKASSESEIDAAFASASEQQVHALVLSPDPFFMTRRAFG